MFYKTVVCETWKVNLVLTESIVLKKKKQQLGNARIIIVFSQMLKERAEFVFFKAGVGRTHIYGLSELEN